MADERQRHDAEHPDDDSRTHMDCDDDAEIDRQGKEDRKPTTTM